MKKSVLCTTIETNRFYPDIMRNTLVPQERAAAMQEIANYGIPTYVTCEPLMKFDPGRTGGTGRYMFATAGEYRS